LNTPILPPLPPASRREIPAETPAHTDESYRRRTGSGGFISVSSICGLVDHRRARKGYWTHYRGTHPGR
jgi:hypothetical protein